MTSPAVVRVSDVSKRFVMHQDKSFKERVVNFGRSRKHREDFWALKDISLDISLGTTVGLVGHNGSGKSTLLKMIGGILQPTSGSVTRRGRMAALLELGAGFHPDLTGRENVYLNSAILGLTRKQTDKYFDAIVEFSGIEEFIDTQVKFYSSGMYVRLAFAVAVHVDPDLLLVDEVLAVGDEPFQQKCMAKIAEFQREGRTIVLVSHSAEQVEQLCHRVVVLRHGSMIFDGESEDGIRVLRSGFEEDRIAREIANGSYVKPAGRVTDIVARPIEHDRGTDLEFTFSYDLDSNIEGLVAGLAIETPGGHEAFGIDTRTLDISIPTGAGQHTITFSLRNQTIGAGHYIVRGKLVAGDVDIDTFQSYSVLVVEPRFLGTGAVSIDTAVRISSASEVRP